MKLKITIEGVEKTIKISLPRVFWLWLVGFGFYLGILVVAGIILSFIL